MDSNTKERRGAPRRRVLKGAIIAYNDRHATLPCTARDLSASGARLRLEGSVVAPDKFLLVIELDGFEVDCEVVRRSGKELAVRFVSLPRSVPPKRVQIVRPLRR